MEMYEKIMAIYPELTIDDFIPPEGTIKLQDDLDERGVFIAEWNHPTLPKPTDEQLAQFD